MSTELDIIEIVDKLIQEKTFSLDALSAIEELKEKAAELGNSLSEAQDACNQYDSDLTKSESHLASASLDIEHWEKRESELKEREANVFLNERAKAVAQARAEVFDHCFKTVFANVTIRRNISRQVAVPYSDSGMAPAMTSEYDDETTTEE